MVLIKSISNAFADVVLMDGRELHVAAKPSALALVSVLAKKAPVETFFDVRTGASKAASDLQEKKAIKRRLILLFERTLFPDYDNDLLADDFIENGITFTDCRQMSYGSDCIDGEKQAVFRLGQMDMQASVCDMLRAMANGAAEGIRPGLTLAADLVESMEVGHGGS